MHVKCNCGIEHFDLNPKHVYTCACGTALTGIFGQEARWRHDDFRSKLRTSILASRLSFFTTEELLDEVKRRIKDV